MSFSEQRRSDLRKRTRVDPKVDLMDDEIASQREPSGSEVGMSWEDRSSTRSHTPMGWLVVIGLLFFSLGGWALSKLLVGKAHRDELVDKVMQDRVDEGRRQAAAQELFKRVESLAEKYLGAKTVEEKSAYVRSPKRVRPLMEDYYARTDLEIVKVTEVLDIESIGLHTNPFNPLSLGSISLDRIIREKDLRDRVSLDKRPFFRLLVRSEDGGKIQLFVEQTPDDQLLFDWESEVSYLPMEPEDYLRQKPAKPMEFRVYARLDTFHSYEFRDTEKYLPLKLTFRDSDEYLFGYVDRRRMDPEDLKYFTEYMERDISQPKALLLRLRFSHGTKERRSVLVEEVVSPYWVRLDSPQ